MSLDHRRQVENLCLNYADTAFSKKKRLIELPEGKVHCMNTVVNQEYFIISRALPFSGWLKSFDKCKYRWATVVRTQWGSKCAESLQIRHCCGIIRGIPGFFGINKKNFQRIIVSQPANCICSFQYKAKMKWKWRKEFSIWKMKFFVSLGGNFS